MCYLYLACHHAQGPTVLLCEPAELQQLWQQVPDDTPRGAWDAAYTKVGEL